MKTGVIELESRSRCLSAPDALLKLASPGRNSDSLTRIATLLSVVCGLLLNAETLGRSSFLAHPDDAPPPLPRRPYLLVSCSRY